MLETESSQRVSGIILWTDQLENLRNFYEQLLGLNPHSVREGFIAYKWGDFRFSLGLHSKIEGHAKDPYRTMINFDTPDISGLSNKLIDNDIECLRRPEREQWGGIVASFRDPDGNIIQFLQQPENRLV